MSDPCAGGRVARDRLLVIDDNALVLATLSDYLRREGFDVEGTVSAIAGLNLARERRYALALIDYGLVEMDGLELGRALAALGQRFVYVSGNLDDTALRQIRDIGALGYVEKPAEPATVSELVKDAIRRT
jgi:DNA-binding response OmpR family regulator